MQNGLAIEGDEARLMQLDTLVAEASTAELMESEARSRGLQTGRAGREEEREEKRAASASKIAPR